MVINTLRREIPSGGICPEKAGDSFWEDGVWVRKQKVQELGTHPQHPEAQPATPLFPDRAKGAPDAPRGLMDSFP